jgi:ketosteroid isomerase-like protein
MSRTPVPRPGRGGRHDAPPPDAAEVQEAVRQINALWLAGRVARLADHVIENVVIVAPDFDARVQGARALVDSFQTFVRNAKVHSFRESELTVDVFGESAMATYRFDMSYDFGGVTYDETGREFWMFVRVDKRWRLAWRYQLPVSRQTRQPG